LARISVRKLLIELRWLGIRAACATFQPLRSKMAVE